MRLTILLTVAACAVCANDTEALRERLRAVHGQIWVAEAEYAALQAEYVAWIDARIKNGATVVDLNGELRRAGVFSPEPDTTNAKAVEALQGDRAGYLEAIEARVSQAGDVAILDAGMYRGAGCALDSTAIVYQRRPVRRIAVLNPERGPREHAYYLSAIDVGPEDSRGKRTVASGWVISNCTSTWNTKRIRIDQISGGGAEQILARDLYAQDRAGENVSARVDGETATFLYNGATGEGDLLAGPSIARCNVADGHAVRVAPIALTRAGFIYEWLRMSDAEATQWSEPEAVASRQSAAALFGEPGFEYQRVANCGGSPPVWEVEAETDKGGTRVFRIRGARATELRMLAVAYTMTPGCADADPSDSLGPIAAELPR